MVLRIPLSNTLQQPAATETVLFCAYRISFLLRNSSPSIHKKWKLVWVLINSHD